MQQDCLLFVELALALILVVVTAIPDNHFAWVSIWEGLQDHLQVIVVGDRPEKLAPGDP